MTQNLLRWQVLSQVVREPTNAHAKILWVVERLKCTATYTIGSVKAKRRRNESQRVYRAIKGVAAFDSI